MVPSKTSFPKVHMFSLEQEEEIIHLWSFVGLRASLLVVERDVESIVHQPRKWHRGKCKWHSSHVLIYLSHVQTHVFGNCANVFWPQGNSDVVMNFTQMASQLNLEPSSNFHLYFLGMGIRVTSRKFWMKCWWLKKPSILLQACYRSGYSTYMTSARHQNSGKKTADSTNKTAFSQDFQPFFVLQNVSSKHPLCKTSSCLHASPRNCRKKRHVCEVLHCARRRLARTEQHL